MSRFLKIIILSAIGALSSTAAFASCNGGSYCGAGSQFTWAPQDHSSSYNMQSQQSYSFSGSPASLPGLGHNESLRPTTCPTAVYNPEGAQVLGCYNVVKPVQHTTYYRVVRPIIYVRYPVPTPVVVPTYHGCSGAGYNNYNHQYSGHHNYHGYSSCR